MEASHVGEVRKKGDLNADRSQPEIYRVKCYIDEKQRHGGPYLNPRHYILELIIRGSGPVEVKFISSGDPSKEREIDPATIDHSKDSPYRFGGGQG